VLLADFGRVDVLCNNAGIYPGMNPVWAIDIRAWRNLFETNYWGVVSGIQEFVPLFIKQGSGHVVNTASMSGLSTVPGSAD
jgi:NADP-dependent 3-hydroxy acid dehydrogenase YdfG